MLSGGESQQLMLARIIANRYPLVILDRTDERAGPFDRERETNRYVSADAGEIAGAGRFCLFRTDCLRRSSRLVFWVFDKGTIVEEGNHCELMEKKGHYYEMYQLQQKLYGQEEIESAKTENDRPE